jgi:hypothetical protein
LKHGLTVSLLAGLISLAAAQGQMQVAISEIMYHPVEEPAFNADGTPVMDLYEDVHEFVELHNWGPTAVSLTGWQLTAAVWFTFTNVLTIAPGQYLVIAKDPLRLEAVPAYGLAPGSVLGPWFGQLGNRRDTVTLRDATGQVVDSVSYSAEFPWAIGADGLGAEEEWVQVKPMDCQYRGRSLERVSFSWPGDDPANWLASPLPGNPSPGRPNAVQRPTPKPIVAGLQVCQTSNGQIIIRGNEAARVDCLFSSAAGLSNARVEYFQDDLNVTNEPVGFAPLLAVGNADGGRFTAELPKRASRALVRYRICADRGDGMESVSPRADDPFAWHAYFVTPVRNATNPVYDLFISTKSLSTLSTNISQQPCRIITPDPPGKPRPSWNATEPAVFVSEGVVYDVQMRHHGSQYRRATGRQSYKVQFPRYRRFRGWPSVFLTDKDANTVAGHALFRAVGLPSSLTRYIDLYLNQNPRLLRLEQEECDEFMLERGHAEACRLDPSQPQLEPGELYKAQGVFESAVGPYGRGDGRPLAARSPHWTALQRYTWTYGLQDHAWQGHLPLRQVIEQHWQARGSRSPMRTNEIPKVREFLAKTWDVDRALTHLATFNWMCVWDDSIHNYFFWRLRDGRWAMLPWDFDNTMERQSVGVSIFTGQPNAGLQVFKESFATAYRAELARKAWWLNNTVLHPENLAALGVHAALRTWSTNRFANVNRQCALGTFQRPARPVNLSPANKRPAPPGSQLQVSAYAHGTNPAPAHLSTTWRVRRAGGDYYAPVFLSTSTNDLVSLLAPSQLLKPGETYFWQCIHTDADGHPSLPSVESSFVYAAPARQPDDIVLNEIMADNRTTLTQGGRYPDWIELYNPGNQLTSLAGFTLTDDLERPARYVFPTNAVVPARGRLLLWCDNAWDWPGLHTGFGLNAAGETVALFRPSAEGPVIVDLVTFGLQLPDLSIGRTPDGLGAWTLNAPTPMAANQACGMAPSKELQINEWMVHPVSGDDWFELYNGAAQPVSLGGLWLTDCLSNPANHQITPLSFIAARGFVQFVADGEPNNGADHVGFRLDAQSGAIGLYQTNGNNICFVLYGLQTDGVSQGRLVDGGAAICAFPWQATPGRSNWADADGDGMPDAWEMACQLNPFSWADGGVDADGDGLSNLAEYRAGTDPHDGHSGLRIESVELRAGSALVVRFTTQPSRAYRVLRRNGLAEQSWEPVAEIPAQPGSRLVSIADEVSPYDTARFYRLEALPSGPGP